MKRKCYYLLTRVPFPPIGGDKLKAYNTIKILSHRYDLNVIIVTTEKASEDAKKFLESFCSKYKIFEYPKYRFVINAFGGLFSQYPLQVQYYFFRKVLKYCEKEVEPGSLAIAGLIRSAKYVMPLNSLKILDMTDSIYLNYLRSKKKATSLLWRIIYSIEIKRLESFEKQCIANFHAVTLTNHLEKEFYSQLGNTAWIPNGVNQQLLSKQYCKGKKANYPMVVFLGKMDYQPNIDAVLWFVNNVLKEIPSLQLKIIGSFPPKKILNLEKKFPSKISVTGFIKDPYQIIYDATAVVAPMQTGAGIQNKILESMAVGQTVITSTLGAQPIIGAENKKHLIICDTADEYLKAIEELSNNLEYGEYIGKNAKNLILEQYTWDIYCSRLFNTIDNIHNQLS